MGDEVDIGEKLKEKLSDTIHMASCAECWHLLVPSCTVRPFKMVVLSKLSISDVDEPRICHTK